jgi:hypothetical protein
MLDRNGGFMTDDVCLVVFITYNYAANIPKIYKYYGENFKNIRILIPYFRSEDDVRIITVYENCRNYQGMFAQAYSRLKDGKFSHYIFVADDCLLNNGLNQNNILNALKQDQTSSFITSMDTLVSTSLNWDNCKVEETGFRTKGVEFKAEIPGPAKAVDLYKRHGKFVNTQFNEFINYRDISLFGDLVSGFYEKATRIILKRRKKIPEKYLPKTIKQMPYPLLMGYSDLLVINAHDLNYFCHLCGVFASMRMFLEIAIPSALAMACSHIITEKDIDLIGVTFWKKERENELMALKKECQNSVRNLFLGDRRKVLYFHPIKLSSWVVD